MKKLSIVFIASIASFALINLVQAKQFGPEKRLERLSQKLALTATQQDYFQNFLDEKKAFRTELKKKHTEKMSQKSSLKANGPLAKLFTQEQISRQDIHASIDEIIAKKRESSKNMVESFVVFYNSLSNEQREKVKPMLRKTIHQLISRPQHKPPVRHWHAPASSS